MRKPNYDFERAQRSMAKEVKAKAKEQKRQQQKGEKAEAPSEAPAAGPESQVRGGSVTPE